VVLQTLTGGSEQVQLRLGENRGYVNSRSCEMEAHAFRTPSNLSVITVSIASAFERRRRRKGPLDNSDGHDHAATDMQLCTTHANARLAF
jgi:hypothetical protein